MPRGVTFTDLSALGNHTVAIGSDGNAYAWGTNSYGLLGTSTYPRPVSTPTKVTTPRGVQFTQVAVGWEFSVALGDDRKLHSWGSNYNGALGTGPGTHDSRVPVKVATPAGVEFQRVVSGGDHSLALTTDGDIYAWGSNAHGELGSGSTSPSGSQTPTRVHAPEGVAFVGISAGAGTSFARGSDGLSYSWGSNSCGQLGDGTRLDLATPSPVLSPEMKAKVTGVTFGAHPGALIDHDDAGSVTVRTPPADEYGAVDVGVSWSVNGEPQPAIALPQAYLYGDAPTTATPASQESRLGAEAIFSTHVTGSPEPHLTWEYSNDSGASWRPVSDDGAVSVSGDSQSIRVAVGPEHATVGYRVVATNTLGAAVSGTAELRVPSRSVTFDTAGGSTVPTQAVLAGGTATEPSSVPERINFELAGWVDSTGSPFDFSRPIVTDTTVFASWNAVAPQRFEVTFDAKGGTGNFPPQTVDAGATATAPETEPERTGYTFSGWELDGAIYDFEAPVDRNLALIAGVARSHC